MIKNSFISLMVIWFLTGCSTENESVDTVNVVTEPSAGELIVKKNCKVCHAQGINGAPIIGNKKMWGPRLSQGEAVLIQHAIDGYELMPAKGGNEDLTNEEITLAVQYFISQVE